jgi:hypothetical protein
MFSPLLIRIGSRIVLTGVFFLLFITLLIAQPGTGGNPGGGGQGGNPGGGQGHPCVGPNPPPNCGQPAPIEGLYFLFLGGLAIGLYFTWQKHRNSKILKD